MLVVEQSKDECTAERTRYLDNEGQAVVWSETANKTYTVYHHIDKNKDTEHDPLCHGVKWPIVKQSSVYTFEQGISVAHIKYIP
jgi:hypothetical protein